MGFTSATASSYRAAIQQFNVEIEHDDNYIDLSANKEIKNALGQQKKTRKHKQKVGSKNIDFYSKFSQRKLSSEKEKNLYDLVWNYDMNEITFENSMLFTSYWTPAFASFHRNKTHHSIYYENIIIDYDDGPYNLYPSKEKFEIFGIDFKEP